MPRQTLLIAFPQPPYCLLQLDSLHTAHVPSLLHTYTFPIRLSLTPEAPNIRTSLSLSSFSQIRSDDPVLATQTEKNIRIYSEKATPPPHHQHPFVHIHGEKCWFSLLGMVIPKSDVSNCFIHLAIRVGSLTHRV